MEIGDWKATQGLNQTFRKARELGIESNLLELEAFGFTVLPPYKAAPKVFYDRMREAVYHLVATEDPAAVDLICRRRKTALPTAGNFSI